MFVTYLCNSKQKCKQFMPENKRNEIATHLNWFSATLRPCVKRITHLIAGPKCFGMVPNAKDLSAEKALLAGLMEKLDQMLDNNFTFFCSSKDLTVVDIVFFNEIYAASKLSGVAPNSNLVKLNNWMTAI